MISYETFKECYKDCKSHKLDKDTMVKEFGENIARVMYCENPAEKFLAILYLNDSLLDRLGDAEYENENLKEQIENMKCCENCKHWIDGDCNLEHNYDCERWNNHNTDDYWEIAK